MKFKRLKDNKPAYTKGRVYNVVEETCEYTGGSLLGFKIDAYSTLLKISENDLEGYPHDIFIKELELVS